MSKKSIQKMSEKEIQQKIKRIENNNKLIEAKIEKLKNQLKLESNSTTIPQKIKILEQHKQCIEAKTKKLQNRLKELESKVLKSTSKTKEKAKNQAKKIETQEYFTDASKRNGKTKIAIYSPTKDIKKSKEIAKDLKVNIVSEDGNTIKFGNNLPHDELIKKLSKYKYIGL